MDEPVDPNSTAEEGSFWRAHPDAGRPPPVALDHRRAAPLRVGRSMVGAVGVVLLLLCSIQIRAGFRPGELLADPSRLLDLSVANRRWPGDRADHAGSFAFKYRDATGPARWPCGFTIRWVFNPAGTDETALADLHEAISRVAEASGARFRYVGTTDVMPTTAMRTAPGADLVVAWATPDESDALGRDDGESPLAVTGTTRQGAVLVNAAVVVNRALAGSYPDGFGLGETRGRILLHELGHVLGLAHVDDSTQVMAPRSSDDYPTAFGAGDRTGLALAGCR